MLFWKTGNPVTQSACWGLTRGLHQGHESPQTESGRYIFRENLWILPERIPDLTAVLRAAPSCQSPACHTYRDDWGRAGVSHGAEPMTCIWLLKRELRCPLNPTNRLIDTEFLSQTWESRTITVLKQSQQKICHQISFRSNVSVGSNIWRQLEEGDTYIRRDKGLKQQSLGRWQRSSVWLPTLASCSVHLETQRGWF